MAPSSASTDAAVVVVATAPRPGACGLGLAGLLGEDGCARLQAGLLARAAAWAGTAGAAYVAFAPEDAADEVAELAPGAQLIAQPAGLSLGDRLTGAMLSAHGHHGGPVILVGVDAPQLGPAHADAALGDLAEGIDVTLGPATDGGCYLVGLREPRPEVFALPAEAWGGPDVFRLTMEAAFRAEMTVAMLRSERELEEPADARAFLADPCTPPELRALLQS